MSDIDLRSVGLISENPGVAYLKNLIRYQKAEREEPRMLLSVALRILKVSHRAVIIFFGYP